jgi:hypothetical protein
VNVAWSGYDSIEDGNHKRFGLFSTDGSEKLGMIELRRALVEGAEEMAALPNPPGRITDIIVSAVKEGGTYYDLFEVYGTFPTPPRNAGEIALECYWRSNTQQCTEEDAQHKHGKIVNPPDLKWLNATSTQVNFRINHDDARETAYCSVKFPGTWTHGPKKLWPGACPQDVCH